MEFTLKYNEEYDKEFESLLNCYYYNIKPYIKNSNIMLDYAIYYGHPNVVKYLITNYNLITTNEQIEYVKNRSYNYIWEQMLEAMLELIKGG